MIKNRLIALILIPLILVLCTVCGVLGYFSQYLFFYQRNIVSGPAMNPTFCEGDLVFSSRELNSDFGYGYVYTFDYKDESYILRLVGKSGDKIVIKDGSVFRNGEKLSERYLQDETTTKLEDGRGSGNKTKTRFNEPEEYVVKQDEYFFLGDNRDRSGDSRYTKFENIKNIKLVTNVLRGVDFKSVGTKKLFDKCP